MHQFVHMSNPDMHPYNEFDKQRPGGGIRKAVRRTLVYVSNPELCSFLFII